MTNKEIVERVREDTAKLLYKWHMAGSPVASLAFDELPPYKKEFYLDRVDKILSHKNIATIDPDAKPPEFMTIVGISELELVEAVRQSMLKEGWVKGVKNE